MILFIIPVHTFQLEWAGGGIPFSIGALRIVPGITRPFTTDIIPGILRIPVIGGVIFRDMDGATIRDGDITIHVTDIHPTDTVKRLSQKDS
jgi:hypothetical protein